MLTLAIKFVLSNWRIFLGAAIVGVAIWAYNARIDSAYNEGKTDGIAEQKKQTDADFAKMEQRYLQRVGELEALTNELGTSLIESNTQAQARLKELEKTWVAKIRQLDTSMYNRQGLKIDCANMGESEIYLGMDFSSIWNSQNREAFAK